MPYNKDKFIGYGRIGEQWLISYIQYDIKQEIIN